MKIFCLCFLLTLAVASANAQQAVTPEITVDSLVRVALADSGKVTAVANKDSLFRLLPKARPGVARLKLIYQIIPQEPNVSVQDLSYHYKIFNWAQKHNDRITAAVVTTELGCIISENGDDEAGAKVCLAGLKSAEQTGNKQAVGVAYRNLSACYSNNPRLSKVYAEKALRFSEAARDTMYTAFALHSLTNLCAGLGHADLAKSYALKAVQWSIKNYREDAPRALLAWSRLVPDARRLKYLRASAAIAANMHDVQYMPEALLETSSYYLEHDRRDSALFYARKGYNLAKGSSMSQLLHATFLLSKCFNSRADSTLKYTVTYYGMRDSLQTIAKAQGTRALAFADEQNRRGLAAQQEADVADLQLYGIAALAVLSLLLVYILWRSNRRGKRANALLQEQQEQLEQATAELEAAENLLIRSQKMILLGELTAGIAHEIHDPLNFVNNFSEVSIALVDEMALELNGGDTAEALSAAADIKQNLQTIRHHSKHADGIVKSMLQHSETGSGAPELTDLNTLAGEVVRLAYYSLRAKDKSFSAEMITQFDPEVPGINVIPQDISSALLSLFNNAFYAVQQKSKTATAEYRPAVELSTSVFTPPSGSQGIYLRIKDNGTGISADITDKIMQPFFTTKPPGEGAGLGLYIAREIIEKGHGGKIDVDSAEGEYTEFAIWLPLGNPASGQ